MMKRVESESMNFSRTHQCLIFRELIATHAEHSPIFQNWRCSVSEYTDHDRFHWYMTKHLCRPQFVFQTKKVQRKHLKKDIYGSWKLTFGLKMSSFLYLQLHFPGACKSLVHQNRKSHSCRSWSRQSVFTSKAQTLTVKAEVWLLSWDFQPRWSLFQRTSAFADPKIWMHCMFWFLSMLTWSWTWTNEDLWELWSGSTHTWIISLRHQQMLLVVVAKYHDLEQATPRSFLSSSNPMGCWTTSGGATMEPIDQVAL